MTILLLTISIAIFLVISVTVIITITFLLFRIMNTIIIFFLNATGDSYVSQLFKNTERSPMTQ